VNSPTNPHTVSMQKGRTMHPLTPSHFERYSSSRGEPRWPDDPDFQRTASPNVRPDPLILLASICIEGVREYMQVLGRVFSRASDPPAGAETRSTVHLEILDL